MWADIKEFFQMIGAWYVEQWTNDGFWGAFGVTVALLVFFTIFYIYILAPFIIPLYVFIFKLFWKYIILKLVFVIAWIFFMIFPRQLNDNQESSKPELVME